MHSWLFSLLFLLAQIPAPTPVTEPAAPPVVAPVPVPVLAPVPVPVLAPVPAAEPVPAAICPLTGLPGDPALVTRNPIAITVENTRDARPQSGLDQAELVFEVHVEGGVTRYIGVFVCTDAEVWGPVRSARQVFVSWAHSIRAILGHCWAKPTGYAKMEELKIRNIDGVRPRGTKTPFYRTETRKGPHNLYTSTAEVRRAAKDRGYESIPMTEPMFSFKDPSPAPAPTHTWIGLDFNGLTYFSNFVYDQATNRYLRFLAGKPHESGGKKAGKPSREKLSGALHDPASVQQIAVENLLVLFESEKVVDKGGVLEVTTTGQGKCALFRDGLMIEGTWKRPKESDRYTFLQADGQPMQFNKGRTWIASLVNPTKLVFAVPQALVKQVDGPVAN